MTKVWALACATHTQKLVLLALADNANDEGECWPSVTTIAKKCDMSERTAHYQIKLLQEAGLLAVTLGGGSKANHYQLLPDRCKPCTGANAAPVQTVHPTGANGAPPPVQGVHRSNITVSTTVIEPSERERGTGPRPAHGRGRKPRDLQEALAIAGQIGVLEQDCRDWFRDCEACGWIRGDGTPFDNWVRQLCIYRDKQREKTGKAASNGPGSSRQPTILDLKSVITIKEEKAKALKEKHSVEGPVTTEWNSPEAKSQYFALRKEIKALKTRIEGMV